MAKIPVPYIHVFSAVKYKPVNGGYKFKSVDGTTVEVELRFLISIHELEPGTDVATRLFRVTYISHTPIAISGSSKKSKVDKFTGLTSYGNYHVNQNYVKGE